MRRKRKVRIQGSDCQGLDPGSEHFLLCDAKKFLENEENRIYTGITVMIIYVRMNEALEPERSLYVLVHQSLLAGFLVRG